MATSGSFNTTTYKGRYLTFSWERISYSVEENFSEISWTIKGGGSAPSSYYYAAPFELLIDDNLVWSSSNRIQLGDGTEVATGIRRLWHYNDGTCDFKAEINGAIYSTSYNVNGSDSYWLEPIPRASTFSLSKSSINMGEKLTINITRASDNFKHKLWYKMNNSSWVVIANGVGTSYTWTVPLSLAENIPNTTSGIVTIAVETFNNTTLIGETRATFTANVPASVAPSISSITISDPNGYASKYSGYVQTKSKVKIQVSASGAYSSTIKSVSINDGMGNSSNSNPYTSNVISVGGGSKKVTVKVTDSRGRTKTKTADFTVLGYSSPKISSLSASRCNASGTADDVGSFVKISYNASITALNNENGTKYKLEYKSQDSSTWTDLFGENSPTSYSASGSVIAIADTEKSYDIRFTATDDFKSSSKTIKLSTAFVLMDFNASGKGIGIGKVSEKNAFECALPAEFSSIKTTSGADLDTVKTKAYGSLKSTYFNNVIGTSSAYPVVDISSIPVGTIMRIEVGIPIDNATSQTIAWFSYRTLKSNNETDYLMNVGGYYYSPNYNASIFINLSKTRVTINDAWTKVIGGANGAIVNNLKSKARIYVYTENL